MSRLALADLLLRDAAALVIMKATVVLTLTSAAAVVARGLSAAHRHALWLAALSSCVWLVLSSPVVPAIVLHTPMLAPNVVATADPSTSAAVSSHHGAVANASRASERFPAGQTVRRSRIRSMPVPSHPLIALWIIGSIALLVRHAIAWAGAARLARRASIANDDETSRELAGAAAALGVRRPVHLGYSTDVQTPITFDVATPYVLLPTEAKSWSTERRRAVLVHEAAHIARGDWLSQAIGQFACALFWFHPLVWRAFAHLQDEAEHAADDAVLRSGMPACEYATHLLALARRTTNVRPDLVAIGIVSTSNLERRFVALFDIERSRTTVTSRARAVVTSVALAIVCPVASLRVAAPQQPARASLPQASFERLSRAHASTPQPPSAARATRREGDAAGVARTLQVRQAIVGQPAPAASRAPIVAVDYAAPSEVAHPDYAGKWTLDTVTGPTADFLVTDSTIITQSASAISFESHGYALDLPTSGRADDISFGGAQSKGVTVTGGVALNLVATAVWVADTLVVKSYAMQGAHDLLTYDRLTLGPDRNTLMVTSVSFVDGRRQWNGPQSSVLRRSAP